MSLQPLEDFLNVIQAHPAAVQHKASGKVAAVVRGNFPADERLVKLAELLVVNRVFFWHYLGDVHLIWYFIHSPIKS